MAKSSGNVFLIEELISRGFDPLAFRYLCLTVRYRHRMNFTFNSLRAAEKALTSMRQRFWIWKSLPELVQLPSEVDEWRRKFWENVENDLDLPGALALTWDMFKSDLPGQAKLALLVEFDEIFGLDLDAISESHDIPGPVTAAVGQRESLRYNSDYARADTIRTDVLFQGFLVEDTGEIARIRPKTHLERRRELWPSVSSSREVETFLDRPAEFDFSFIGHFFVFMVTYIKFFPI